MIVWSTTLHCVFNTQRKGSSVSTRVSQCKNPHFSEADSVVGEFRTVPRHMRIFEILSCKSKKNWKEKRIQHIMNTRNSAANWMLFMPFELCYAFNSLVWLVYKGVLSTAINLTYIIRNVHNYVLSSIWLQLDKLSRVLLFIFQIDEDLKEENAKQLLNQEIDLDKPGNAQFYCLHCA